MRQLKRSWSLKARAPHRVGFASHFHRIYVMDGQGIQIDSQRWGSVVLTRRLACGGGPLRWRLHLINQYRNVYLAPPNGLNVALTGSIRTNWHINCTDSTATTRFTLSRETSPGNLPLLLPRDAWFELSTIVR